MTSYPIPSNYADHILVASPSTVVRQRVLESLRSPRRCFAQATGGAEALVHLESGFWRGVNGASSWWAQVYGWEYPWAA